MLNKISDNDIIHALTLSFTTTEKLLRKTKMTKAADELMNVFMELKKRIREPSPRAMPLKFSIKHGELPAFGGFIQGSAINGEIEILIDSNNSILVASEYNDINFYDLLAENTVHEMIHAFQELYRKAFSEEEVEAALEQGKNYLKEQEING